jgi:uncharacterized protein (DUF2336 family)
MVAYRHFLALSRSSDSAQRSQAAHIVGAAYVEHDGPADEKAALYAAVIEFLDDTSVKVRAALAYGLLRAPEAPRLVMLSLAKDAPIIARAVVQYSPVLLDVDLISVIRSDAPGLRDALCDREGLSHRLINELIAGGGRKTVLRLLSRLELDWPVQLLVELSHSYGDDAKVRGKLLRRPELPAFSRLILVEKIRKALGTSRMVRGAVTPERLEALMRDALDKAITRMGESEADGERLEFARSLQDADRINTRLLLHALVNGRVLFFADCISLLAKMPSTKVFGLLHQGSRVGLNALLARCGMAPALRNLLARLVMFARSADLSDLSARHFVVTALVEELIIEHDGIIPQELEFAFAYLNEQNLRLARSAARGVMPGFSQDSAENRQMPGQDAEQAEEEQLLALPAA